MNPLQEYTRKRDFKKTSEPKGLRPQKSKRAKTIFVVQEHHASHLHYDFRLEMDGVLKSWAVPKGPSMNPKDKRLAVEVEDHPLSYAKFHGTIPAGQYGAGEVYIWDHGFWEPIGDPQEGLEQGHLAFSLKGKKLNGHWLLIRTRNQTGKKPQWLLMKRSEAKTAKQIRTKKIASSELTHPEKVLYPEEGITKGDVAQYYEEVNEWMMPHILRRPLSLLRCPAGASEKCFFQKHYREGDPKAIRCITVKEKTKTECYVSVESLEGTQALVQMGTLEIHTWNSREETLEKPDQLVFDFDPGPGVLWEQVIEAAFEIKEILAKMKLNSLVKMSGGKGLHVHVPIQTGPSWNQVRVFAKALAEEMSSRNPKLYISEMAKARRQKKIFVDYLRNTRGATAVAPYSLRAKSVSSVAMPLEWQELKTVPNAAYFTIERALQKIKQRKKDPWANYFDISQELPSLKDDSLQTNMNKKRRGKELTANL